MTDNIDPVAVVPPKRRKITVNYKMCLICQTSSSSNISEGTELGIAKIQEACHIRRSHEDDSFTKALDIITSVDSLSENNPKWHKACYASFTSKVNLQNVIERHQRNQLLGEQPGPSHKTPEQEENAPLTRKIVQHVNWKLCIFCQQRKRDTIHLVQSEGVQNLIRQKADFDYKLKCRIGANDLIAYEAHYHKSCKYQTEKDLQQIRKTTQQTTGTHDAAFHKLVDILDRGFKQGWVYSMDNVLQKYLALLQVEDLANPSYTSQKLKVKLQHHYGDHITFRQQRDRRQPLLVFGTITTGEAIETLKASSDGTVQIPGPENQEPLKRESEFLYALHHVTLKIRADLEATPGHDSYANFSEDAIEKCVPDSLYNFFKWVVVDAADDDEAPVDQGTHKKILDICQTVVYAASHGRKKTPKQIGTGLLVHHATRSKKLVDHLHDCGDSISYDTVQRITTSIAEAQLSDFEKNDSTFIPRGIVSNKFVQFAADNLDILEETLDGKGTFHVTQMVAFQTGPGVPTSVEGTRIGRSKSLKKVPPEFHQIHTVIQHSQAVQPILPRGITAENLLAPAGVSKNHESKDLAWILSRLQQAEDQHVPAWTGFNQTISNLSKPLTTVAVMPILPAPAHEMDTIMTVLLRCKQISKKLGQPCTVVTFDEALYCKAKELVWSHPEQLDSVIVRLGGFHTAMNYLHAIGTHMQGSGLGDVWVESGVYTECTSVKILQGKSWNRAVRAHKLTMEASWRLLLQKFSAWQTSNGRQSYAQLCDFAAPIAEIFLERSATDYYSQLDQNKLDNFMQHIHEFRDEFEVFLEEHSQNSTFTFWKMYIDLVQILLNFVRAEREGNWELHLEAFQQMLPLMAAYDHTNYTRWGIVYLADMKNLQQTAPAVYNEFTSGNFGVKRTEGAFNQLPTDQALEHINKLCKIAGGLVGITRNRPALDRWMLTCNDLAQIVDEISSHARRSKNKPTHSIKEVGHHRLQRDEGDLKKIQQQLASFKPFDIETTDLVCISTNDVASTEIKRDLLSARTRGNVVLTDFIENRLSKQATKVFRDPLVKNKSRTFANLFDVDIAVPGKTKNIKADRDLLRRLLSATASGRKVDLSSILMHELTPVPLALALTDGSLRKTDKASLAHILCDKYEKDALPRTDEKTCMLIDAMAVVQAIGKPANCTTFGELAECFCKSILSHFSGSCTRVDVVFDTYRQHTIKAGTRVSRSSGKKKIRRLIDNPSTKLPSSWHNFISMEDNKVNLTHFLVKELMVRADKLKGEEELIVAGGGVNPEEVVSSRHASLPHLFSSHEEADTRLVLHGKDAEQNGYKRVVIKSKDTDVLVLFLYHETTAEVWMDAGTTKKPKHIPVHQVRQSLQQDVVKNLLAFHAITGCDSTSQFAAHGKKTAWKTYVDAPTALDDFDDFRNTTFHKAEYFVMKLYDCTSKSKSINALREEMFHRISDPEKLPPTHDALMLHFRRAQYQTVIWKSSNQRKPTLPSPEECGWTLESNKLCPLLMSQDAVPAVCIELLVCGCKTEKCISTRCACCKNNLGCSIGCACHQNCQNPNNPVPQDDDDSSDDEH